MTPPPSPKDSPRSRCSPGSGPSSAAVGHSPAIRPDPAGFAPETSPRGLRRREQGESSWGSGWFGRRDVGSGSGRRGEGQGLRGQKGGAGAWLRKPRRRKKGEASGVEAEVEERRRFGVRAKGLGARLRSLGEGKGRMQGRVGVRLCVRRGGPPGRPRRGRDSRRRTRRPSPPLTGTRRRRRPAEGAGAGGTARRMGRSLGRSWVRGWA